MHAAHRLELRVDTNVLGTVVINYCATCKAIVGWIDPEYVLTQMPGSDAARKLRAIYATGISV